MALTGGGGSPNAAAPAGSSTNFVTLGDRLYGYSGSVQTNASSLTTIFRDHTPQDANYLLRIYTDIAANAAYTLYIDVNGIRIGQFYVNGDEAYPSTQPFELLVPADTDVHIQAFAASGTPTQYARIIGEMV